MMENCYRCNSYKNNRCIISDLEPAYPYKGCHLFSFKGEEKLINPFDTQVGGDHYKKKGVMDPTEWCMANDLDIGEFNVIKYTFRHPKKGGIEDLRKAKHYLEMVAYMKYGENL